MFHDLPGAEDDAEDKEACERRAVSRYDIVDIYVCVKRLGACLGESGKQSLERRTCSGVTEQSLKYLKKIRFFVGRHDLSQCRSITGMFAHGALLLWMDASLRRGPAR